MVRATGIYIRDSRIQVAEVDGNKRNPRLRSLVTRHFEEGDGGVEVLLAQSGISRGRVYLVLPSAIVRFRKVVLPLKGDEQIRRTVKFQAERLIPGLDPDEAAVDFVITERGSDYTEILLAVVRKRDIAACRERLDVACIVPVGVTVDLVATFNLLAAAGALTGAPLVMAIDFGPECIHLLLARDGQLVQLRKLIQNEQRDLAEWLTAEIRYTLKSMGEDMGPGKVVLAGRQPQSSVVESLAKELLCPVIAFNPLGYLNYVGELDIDELARESTVAPGAALAGLGVVALALDFKQAEKKLKSGYERLRQPMLAAVLLLVAWIAVQFLLTMQQSANAADWLQRLELGAKQQFKRVTGGDTPSFSRRDFHKKLASLARKRRQEGDSEEGWQGYFEFLRLLAEMLPLDDKTVITTVNYKGGKATLRGEADDVASIERLAQVLAASGRFAVRAPLRKRSRQGLRGRKAFTFTIEFSPRSK